MVILFFYSHFTHGQDVVAGASWDLCARRIPDQEGSSPSLLAHLPPTHPASQQKQADAKDIRVVGMSLLICRW